ncbi:MAG TPA: acyl carrier protein [Elainellaceae cyanobacterium]
MDEIKIKVKSFLAQFLGSYDLSDDIDIFSLGFINSMFAMQLVLFIEQEFKLTVENEDLDLNNFRTVNAIAHLIKKKTALPTL